MTGLEVDPSAHPLEYCIVPGYLYERKIYRPSVALKYQTPVTPGDRAFSFTANHGTTSPSDPDVNWTATFLMRIRIYGVFRITGSGVSYPNCSCTLFQRDIS